MLRGSAEALRRHTRRAAWHRALELHAALCPWLMIKGFFVPSAQHPPRGPRPSVSAGGRACCSTTVAHPETTSTCPSVMTWATSSLCSATARVTSAGVWTRMAERCRAPAPGQALPLHVSGTRGFSVGRLCVKVGKQGVNRSSERSHYCVVWIYNLIHPRSQFGLHVWFCH